MTRALRIALAMASCLSLVACDGGGGTADAGSDGSTTPGACDGASDGDSCGSGLICVSGACVASECGDGFLDTAGGEECDDGNDVAFDGCEPGICAFTCDGDGECDDGRACNGAETCNTDHVCAAGATPAPGSACTMDGGGDGVCRGEDCVAAGCGNGVPDSGEDCDDGNDVDGDGCDTDCTFSCTEDSECADGDTCNGDEVCNTTTHACDAGMALECDDGDACTDNGCDPVEGCMYTLIDGDMDGHAPSSLGACGDDCNDDNPAIYTGAEELCDGLDNNCNTDVDEVAPTWYIDCDDDGYAASTDGSRTGCTEPAATATGCGGGWTTVRPVDTATTDCHDGNANVRPNQTRYFTTTYLRVGGGSSWDYNCDGGDSRQYGCTSSSASCSGSTCTDSAAGFTDCSFSCSGLFCFYTPKTCGYTGEYTYCGLSLCLPPCTGGSCSRRTTTRTQGCR